MNDRDFLDQFDDFDEFADNHIRNCYGMNSRGCQNKCGCRPCPPPPRPCHCPCPSMIAGPTGPTAPSIYAQQGKCRNHAAFSTLKTIKHPL